MGPKYLTLLAANELEARVEKLEALLASCTVCPKDCGNDRLKDEIAACYSGRLPIVSSYTAHFGEEPVLSGTHGAGNIFFGNCNLRCVYCQNYQISQTWKAQRKNEVTHERLAEIMLELQDRGCHNIGFVSPTHFAPQIARAILIAAKRGLRLPIVYNTNAYDSVEVLRLLDGLVDIYLPDLKYADSEAMRISVAIARQKPPPIAGPLIAPITGWCMSWIALITSSRMRMARRAMPGIVRPLKISIQPGSSRSAPGQKPAPAPVTTTTRVSLSKLTSSSATLRPGWPARSLPGT